MFFSASENVMGPDSNLPQPETLGMVAENLPGLSKTRGPQFQSDNSISVSQLDLTFYRASSK